MKNLFFYVIFKLLVNLPDMHGSLYFFEVRISFFGHFSKLNNMLSFFSNFFDVFPLLSKVFLFQFLHVFIGFIENFETMGHRDPLYPLYKLLSISRNPLLISNLPKVNVNIIDTDGAQLRLNIKFKFLL